MNAGTKTLEENFVDWEANVFGFGYGTGEPHTISALYDFLSAVKPAPERTYDYAALEQTMGPRVTWLLINVLCGADIIEYGTSPRYGWLSASGEALSAFMLSKTIDELVAFTYVDDDYLHCDPDICNCGPDGYEVGRVCRNPFWRRP